MIAGASRPQNILPQVGTPGVAALNENSSASVGRGTPIGSPQSPQFQDLLKDKLGSVETKSPTVPNSNLKFSNHAIERMQSRGIRFNAEDMKRLDSAIEKATQKGSKDTLVLMNETALIVNIKNRTVVTAMDKAQMKENVFTNIDSTVVI